MNDQEKAIADKLLKRVESAEANYLEYINEYHAFLMAVKLRQQVEQSAKYPLGQYASLMGAKARVDQAFGKFRAPETEAASGQCFNGEARNQLCERPAQSDSAY